MGHARKWSISGPLLITSSGLLRDYSRTSIASLWAFVMCRVQWMCCWGRNTLLISLWSWQVWVWLLLNVGFFSFSFIFFWWCISLVAGFFCEGKWLCNNVSSKCNWCLLCCIGTFHPSLRPSRYRSRTTTDWDMDKPWQTIQRWDTLPDEQQCTISYLLSWLLHLPDS